MASPPVPIFHILTPTTSTPIHGKASDMANDTTQNRRGFKFVEKVQMIDRGLLISHFYDERR